jgi:hypothetical protein
MTRQGETAALLGCRRRTSATAILMLALLMAAHCGRGTPPDATVDPANELPFGRVDAPVEGAQVTPQTTVGGWAMDDTGIREVRLYIDGHFAASVQLNTERPDVRKAYPQYARNTNRHGWTTTVQFDTPGPHALLAQAVDTSGATRDIGSITVLVQGQ